MTWQVFFSHMATSPMQRCRMVSSATQVAPILHDVVAWKKDEDRICDAKAVGDPKPLELPKLRDSADTAGGI